MSHATIQTDGKEDLDYREFGLSGSAEPAWWIILSRELADLWLGGKALYLIMAFSILLGIETFVLATNFELSLFTPPEMVFETLKSALQVSLLIGLIIGADSISGERERATLEGILLTPASRRQIIFGKFLAALSAWPVALVITVPFLLLLSQGSGVLGPAVLWGLVVGAMLVPAFTAIGTIVSLWCNSNKTSFFIGLGIFLVFILMGQVLGPARTGLWGQLLQWLNPIPAGFDFLSRIIIDRGTFADSWRSLQSPFVFAIVVLGVLFLYIGPRLKVEMAALAGVSRLGLRLRRMLGLTMVAGLVLAWHTHPAVAFNQGETPLGEFQVVISEDARTVKTGDSVNFDTVITNLGTEQSQPLIAAMNIINLSKTGDVVDPEDWSPERTQYIDTLGPTEAITLTWQVNAVLDGNYMVYIVVVPAPESEGTSSQTVASRGLHLSVSKFTTLNPGGVLPYAIGVPVVVGLAIIMVFRLRRRQLDMGAPEEQTAN